MLPKQGQGKIVINLDEEHSRMYQLVEKQFVVLLDQDYLVKIYFEP